MCGVAIEPHFITSHTVQNPRYIISPPQFLNRHIRVSIAGAPFCGATALASRFAKDFNYVLIDTNDLFLALAQQSYVANQTGVLPKPIRASSISYYILDNRTRFIVDGIEYNTQKIE